MAHALPDRDLFRKLLPLLLLATHAFLAVLLIALGRSGGELQSALTSHYAFAPTLFWIALVVVGGAAVTATRPSAIAHMHSIPLAAVVILIGFLAVGFARTNAAGFREAYTRHRNLRMAEASLFARAGRLARFFATSTRPMRSVCAGCSATCASIVSAPSPATPCAGEICCAIASRRSLPMRPRDSTTAATAYGTVGWAWIPASPDRPVLLDVWAGNTLLGTVTANWFRWDLLSAGKGDGQHAFRFLFPTQSELQTGRVVTVTFAGTTRTLPGSPKAVPCRD